MGWEPRSFQHSESTPSLATELLATGVYADLLYIHQILSQTDYIQEIGRKSVMGRDECMLRLFFFFHIKSSGPSWEWDRAPATFPSWKKIPATQFIHTVDVRFKCQLFSASKIATEVNPN